MTVLCLRAAIIPSGTPTMIANRNAYNPSSTDFGKCSLMMSFTVCPRRTSEGPKSSVKTPFT